MYRQIILFCFVLLWILQTFVGASEKDLLKTGDIHKIMEQMLSYHDNKTEMSQKILRHGLEVFAEQFDSYSIYLIQSEIEPLINPGAAALQQGLNSYNSNRFPMFSQLNEQIQSSIRRARQWRSQTEKNSSAVFKDFFDTYEEKLKHHFYSPKEFVKDVKELEKRMKNHLMHYLDEQRHKYGEKSLKDNQKQVLDNYESYMRSFENQYLYQDEKGQSLPTDEQENLFAIHVLKALASSLDPHTSFYNANEAYDMKIRLKKGFQGVGVVLGNTKEGIIITGFVPNGAAEKNGLIKVNDMIIEVDGQSIVNYSPEQALELLHNSKNTSIVLELKRQGENQSIRVALEKQPISLNQDRAIFSSETFGDGIIGMITLHSFYQSDDGVTAAGDVAKAIEELRKRGHLRGLILDLRQNSGGFLSQAVKLAGLFITNGVVVISKYSNGEEKFYRDIDSSLSYDGPLVILTSRMTASAAEIVAQTLQDYGVSLIAGDEQTFGKGTIQTQTITDNESTSYFKVTVGKYYTVSGKTPQLHGVKADIVVPSRLNAEEIGEEYLKNTITSDNKTDVVPAVYDDLLIDVEPLAKSWYFKYYTPTLQHKVTRWKNMLPTLRKNSAYRIEHNKDYQLFLKKGKESDDEEDEEWPFVLKKQKDFGENDLQVNEAFNIIKDMVQMDATKPR
jgi:carboxyl-terminal processing protease